LVNDSGAGTPSKSARKRTSSPCHPCRPSSRACPAEALLDRGDDVGGAFATRRAPPSRPRRRRARRRSSSRGAPRRRRARRDRALPSPPSPTAQRGTLSTRAGSLLVMPRTRRARAPALELRVGQCGQSHSVRRPSA
jgi:hypothetical protein